VPFSVAARFREAGRFEITLESFFVRLPIGEVGPGHVGNRGNDEGGPIVPGPRPPICDDDIFDGKGFSNRGGGRSGSLPVAIEWDRLYTLKGSVAFSWWFTEIYKGDSFINMYMCIQK
jgi:hypothetical protein